jgi:signal transduction histidine kinase
MSYSFLTDGTFIPITPLDILTFLPIFTLVCLLFFLSNREIQKSLEQSRIVQNLLLQDRKRLQSKLDKSIEDLEENRLKRLDELTKAAEFGRLSQGLFHDLMTPLTSIILHTEKLREGDTTGKTLEKALEANRRMSEYVKEIRTSLSHEEKEKECSINGELESVLQLLSYRIKKENVHIEKRIEENIAWYGNPLKLRQIFLNLISNSLDAFQTRAGEDKKINIKIIQVGTYLHISIQDNGMGIPEENLEKIFEPFFTTKPLDKGTGIGLTTVKTIIEKDLKGNIQVESAEGRGSLFTITFPV